MSNPAGLDLGTAEDAIVEEFSWLDSWEERYEHIINMRKILPEFDPALKQPTALVHGCMSELWAVASYQADNDRIRFKFASDALISLGLAALLWRLVDQRQPGEICHHSFTVFSRLGLDRALSVRRGNGFLSLIKRVKNLSQSYVNDRGR